MRVVPTLAPMTIGIAASEEDALLNQKNSHFLERR
jgi:hypothetical protein